MKDVRFVAAGVIGLALLAAFFATYRIHHMEYFPGQCSSGMVAELRGVFLPGGSSVKGPPYYLRVELPFEGDSLPPDVISGVLSGQSTQLHPRALALRRVSLGESRGSASTGVAYYLVGNLNVSYEDYKFVLRRAHYAGGLDEEVAETCVFNRNERFEVRIRLWDYFMSV